MMKDGGVPKALALFLVVLGYVFGLAQGYSWAKSDVRRSAVEAGVAEYKVDAKTGKTWFEWRKIEGVGK